MVKRMKLQRARKQQRRNRTTTTRTTTTSALVPVGPPTQRLQRVPRMKPMLRNKMQISDAGLAFLKCAFASPDFSVDPGKGIPDLYHGRTLSIKDCATTPLTFTGGSSGSDTYIVVAPIPGYAYFRVDTVIGQTPSNTTPLTGVPFPTYDTNFGSAGGLQNYQFSKFRYASMAAGIYPTTNYMQFSGSIQAWKLDCSLAEKAVAFTDTLSGNEPYLAVRLEGLQGITPVAPRDNYSQSFIKGAYSFGLNLDSEFKWSDFLECGHLTAFTTSGATLPNTQRLNSDGTRPLTGFGRLETIVFKITTPANVSQTALMKTWNCIELSPNTNSSLYQFSGISPGHDPVAMQLYSMMRTRFPVAVCAEDNAHFWENVLRVIQVVTKAGSYVPGPVGLISGGLSVAADELARLVL